MNEYRGLFNETTSTSTLGNFIEIDVGDLNADNIKCDTIDQLNNGVIQILADIVPSSTGARDLGDPSLKFGFIYTDNIDATNIVTNDVDVTGVISVTNISEQDYLGVFINNIRHSQSGTDQAISLDGISENKRLYYDSTNNVFYLQARGINDTLEISTPGAGATNINIQSDNINMYGIVTADNLSTGVVHSDINGVLTSSDVIASDISSQTANNGYVLKADGLGAASWQLDEEGGDVFGPSSAVDNSIVRFDLTTGKIIQDSGVIIDDSDNITGVANLSITGTILDTGYSTGILHSDASGVITSSGVVAADIDSQASASGYVLTSDGLSAAAWTALPSFGDVAGPASSTDNAIARFDLTTGKIIQNSGVIIDDSNNISGINDITCDRVDLNYIDNVGGSTLVDTSYFDITGIISVDQINEFSSDTGVTVDGCLIKDGACAVANTVSVADSGADTTTWVMLAGLQSGNQQAKTDAGLTYNASTNALTATTFIGALSGNATTATSSTSTNNVVLGTTSDTTCSIVLANNQNSTAQELKYDSGLSYNATSDTLTTTNLIVGTKTITTDGNPVGTILIWSTLTAPTNYLWCDGSSYSTTTYAELFAIIGYTYGGSGGNFNVPEMRGRFPLGYGIGPEQTIPFYTYGGSATKTLATAELPAHTHGSGTLTTSTSYLTTSGGATTLKDGSDATLYLRNTITGSTASTGSGNSFSILNPYSSVNFCIKYQN
jgi:microcystin-dependent protein